MNQNSPSRTLRRSRSRVSLATMLLLITSFFTPLSMHAQTAANPALLTWDTGATDAGTAVAVQPSTALGKYYFRINTKSSDVWRTRLKVTSGEAHLYLMRGQVPVIDAPGVRKSDLVGSDGLLLGSTEFAPGENWFILVDATGASNSWSLVSGSPFVKDLGSLPFTDTNNDGSYTIGEASQNAGVTLADMPPEGTAFYKVTLPQNVPAWSLWMSGGNQLIGVRKSKVPVLFGTNNVADRKQNGSLLLVPPYLGAGTDSYFVSVTGIPGSPITMDSRIQQVESMAFNGEVTPFSVSGAPYRVFRVNVPTGEIAWDLSLDRVSGDPSIAIKKDTVPAETENDAVSEAPGEVDDSLSIVAPVLTDGVWYVTVYGTGSYSTGIISGPPVISDIGYRDIVENTQPNRLGWKYYRVPDFAAQVGTLGWELLLANAPPGTELAIRRAQIPGIWKKRTGGSTNLSEVKFADVSSRNNILQRVDHEADIWYVGVYQPSVPLGNFTLTLNDITATPATVQGSLPPVMNQPEGAWKYYRFVIPDDPNLLGWYLNLIDVSGTAAPKITVRRDRLPPSSASVNATDSTWASGASWAQASDFTGVMKNEGDVDVSGQQFLAARGTNRPLVPGTYFVGVLAGAAQPSAGEIKTATFTLQSRGIGSGYSIPITPIALNGGSAATGQTAARDFKMYSVTVPVGANIQDLKLDLTLNTGEMLMQVRKDSIPDFFSTTSLGLASSAGGKRLKRTGGESLVILPENGQTLMAPGTYYIAAVSEGLAPTPTVMGSGQASGVLSSTTPTPVTQLGSVTPTAPLAVPVNLKGGDLAIYRVTVPSGMKVLEAFLSNRVGNPGLSMIRGIAPPVPFPGTTSGNNGYGWVGGQTIPTHPVFLTVQDPIADQYTIVVRANADNSGFVDGTATLNIRLVSDLVLIDPVNGSGVATVTNQIAESWRYFQLNIPNDARLKGIRVTLKNVTSGVPRMIIRKGTQMPRDFTTTSGFNSDVGTWQNDQQWAQGGDFTKLSKDSTGAVVTGRYFLAAYDAPMNAGSYIIGVSKDASINTVTTPDTPAMSYSVVAEGIGTDLDIPITTINFNNTASPAQIVDLPEREMRFYQVSVPAGRTSWRIHLAESLTTDNPPKVRDGGIAIRRGRIPSFDVGTDPDVRGGANVKLIAQGDHWALLPKTTNAQLVAGDYFIAVTSFGQDPGADTGPGSSSLTLFSKGELPVDVFPTLIFGETISRPYNLGPAEIAAYEFTVPARGTNEVPYGLSLGIDRQFGAANYSMRKVEPSGLGLPTPPGKGTDGFFGGLSQLTSTTDEISGRIFQEIEPGTYRVIVRSSQAGSSYGNSSGSLTARLLLSSDIPTLQFDGENLSVTNAGATTDILQYRVEIPDEPNWQAWGIRLDGPVGGRPAIIIRRAEFVESSSGPSVNSDMIDWPPGHQWTQTNDFTKLKNEPGPTNDPERDRSQQFFMASREKPLQPGTYYVGIDNRGTQIISPRTFTIRTFAVGEGYSIPLNDLSEIGATSAIEIGTPRMPSVHKITIPPLTKAWAVSLTSTLGDLTLRVRYGSIPDPVDDPNFPTEKGGVHVQKSGEERFTLLPQPGATFLPEGDYFLAAVSEGQNSIVSSQTIGTGTVVGTIKNEGPLNITPLGTVSESGLAQPFTLAAAEVKLFSVVIPPGINNLEFRLKDRAGEANMSILRGTQIPAPNISEKYGVFGGETAGPPLKERSIINLANPLPGTYTIAVRAAGSGQNYAPASATLTANVIKPSPLNFAEQLNSGNGLSHTDSRTLADKEKYFYRVAIPRQVQSNDVLGWLITLEEGTPKVSIYKSESDFGTTPAVTLVGRTALLVPPFLTFDSNWFIEVEGVGSTDYRIKSQPVQLSAAPWSLPTAFNLLGGDSSPGQPDGAGIFRDLAQDAWDFYALDVPENNLGLMRLALEQNNGNSNVYVRYNAIPTIDHRSTGSTGTTLFDYKMIATTSEAGNFSEVSNTVNQPDRLRPGRYYVAVKSEPVGSTRTGSGYRLKAHSGVVTDLNLTTSAPVTNQNLAERDWRYYRFTVPRTGIPTEWRPFFERISGNASAYIRDTLPPFSFVPLTSTSITSPTFTDWFTDLKNKAPTSAFQRNLQPGTAALAVPPLRPGATYFLGLYGGTSGGSVTVSSSVSTQQVQVDAELQYNTGNVQLTVPAAASRLVRIVAPSAATRLKILCAQSADGLSLKLEQGSVPFTASVIAAHRQNLAAPVNFTFNEVLGATWPFVSKQDYYLLLTNPTASSITSTVTALGSNETSEDEDGDGLPDAWERTHFGNLAQTASGDFDDDGSSNLQEFENNTIPTDPASVLYNLSVVAPGGSVTLDPSLVKYPSSTSVNISASPAIGDTFREWRSDLAELNGSTNPTANITMFSNVTATAVFQTTVVKGLDAPSSMVFSDFNGLRWYGQYVTNRDGTDAAVSAAVSPNQQSRISTTVTGPGVLSFWWRVSSLANSGQLALLINSVVQSTPAPISGTTGSWAQVTVNIPAGNTTIAWRYSRDGNSLTAGENRAFVDQVTFIPEGFQERTFEVWKTEQFTFTEQGNAAISGPNADPDFDGIANLMEAAIGSSPKLRNAQGSLLSIVSTSITTGQRTSVLAAQRAETFLHNLKMEIQVSETLAENSWITLVQKTGTSDWSAGSSISAIVNESAPATGSVPLQVQETIPAAGTSKRLYRMRVSLVSQP